MCLINPKNIILSQLTGHYGLGMGSFQFDWKLLTSYLGSPIITPRWAQANILIGFVLFSWIIIPIFYYTNLWNSKTLPIATFDTVLVDTGNNFVLHASTGTILFYGMYFASLSSILIHTVLYHGRDIIKQFRTSLYRRDNDIHCKLMSKYPEVPEWWYGSVFILSFTCACIVMHLGHFMKWYFVCAGVGVALVYILPTGILAAKTNQILNIKAIGYIIGAVAISDNPIGFLTFKTFVIQTQIQALTLILYLKLSHFMKIPPRALFSTVVIGTSVSVLTSYAMADYFLNNIKDICVNNVNWTCPHTTHSWVSVDSLWGENILSSQTAFIPPTGIYSSMLWFFLIGALLPIPFWLLNEKYWHRIKWLKHVHFPLIFFVGSLIPTMAAGTVPTWLFIGFFFSTVIHKWWWNRYGLLFSSGMDIGVAIATIIIYFSFINRNISFSEWWGIGGPHNDGCPLSQSPLVPSY
ncbi:unnamed protein product [Didymodactylos carnosus]|nr:unnamed protein product [Didymodactylos carnosus]